MQRCVLFFLLLLLEMHAETAVEVMPTFLRNLILQPASPVLFAALVLLHVVELVNVVSVTRLALQLIGRWLWLNDLISLK